MAHIIHLLKSTPPPTAEELKEHPDFRLYLDYAKFMSKSGNAYFTIYRPTYGFMYGKLKKIQPGDILFAKFVNGHEVSFDQQNPDRD